MPINETHKEFIEQAISHFFADPLEVCSNLKLIIAAIKKDTQTGQYAPLSCVYHHPEVIYRIDGSGAITRGEAREYIVEYLDQKFAEIFVNPKMVGWDKSSLMTMVQEMEDHKVLLVTEGVTARDWQWAEHEMSVAQQRALNDPITRMLQLPNARELVRTNRMNEQQAIVLGAERLAVLISPGGKKLLEGENPRLTIEQASTLTVDQIAAMKSSQELVFSDVRQLNKPQAKGIILGLSLEQVRVENYGEHTLEAINILRGNESSLPLNEAYQRVAGLNRAQVEERVPRIVQVGAERIGRFFGLPNNRPSVNSPQGGGLSTTTVSSLVENLRPEQRMDILRGLRGVNLLPAEQTSAALSSNVVGREDHAQNIRSAVAQFSVLAHIQSSSYYSRREEAGVRQAITRLAATTSLSGVNPILTEQPYEPSSFVIGGSIRIRSREHHSPQNQGRSV